MLYDMHLWRICFVNKRFLQLIKRNYSRRMELELNKAYIWSYENTDQFELHLRCQNSEQNLNTQMKFEKKMSDDLGQLLRRISIKFGDALNRSNRKRKGKKSSKEIHGNESSSFVDISVQLLKNDVPVADKISCQEIFFTDLTSDSSLHLKIADTLYTIHVNIPVVKKIFLPKYMMVGFLVYPRKFDMHYANIEECECQWYRLSKHQAEAIAVGNDFTYIPSSNDIGYYLKLVFTPKKNGISGPSVSITSKKTVEGSCGICPFEKRQIFTPSVLSGNSFRIMTYNILSCMYTDTELGKMMFSNCPDYALSRHYRKLLILKEICGYHADLICLQEVDQTLFELDISPILASENLEGVFFKKAGSGGEGIAIYFRKNRFRLLDNKGYILGTDIRNMECLKSIWAVLEKHDTVMTNFVDRTTVFQVITLEHIETGNILLLANTHLYFKPDADHIRLLQAGMAIYIINDMINSLKKTNSKSKISAIFCGDFNSTPECGVYKLFTENEIPINYVDWCKDDETIVGLSLQQPLKLDSACGTPEFTHYTQQFQGCLDYIFYDKSNLVVEQVIPLPETEEILNYGGLPNAVFPSDHISLVADIKWK